jgi:hypothetical protein
MRIALIVLPLLVSCGLGPKTTNPDDTGDSGENNSGGTTIADLQAGLVSSGDIVTLNNVIATTGLTADGQGFFAQDAGGGEWSGLYVYMQGGLEDVQIEAGLKLTLTGEVKEFPAEEAETETELVITSATNIVVTGNGDITVDEIDPSSVTDWEPWESCIVSMGAGEAVSGINNYGEVELDNGLLMDNLFFDFQASLGDTWENITGPVGYKWGEWKVFPRTEGDLEGWVGVPVADPTETDIETIQSGAFADDTLVSISGVVATSGLTASGGGFYVQTAGGGENSGLYIYLWSEIADEAANLAPGDELTLEGYVTEYETDGSSLTELTIKDSGKFSVTASGETVTVDTVDADTVTDWEVWEGCLVQLGTATTTGEVDSFGAVALDNGLTLDNQFYDMAPALGTTYSSLTGLVSDYYGWKLNPRSASDLEAE